MRRPASRRRTRWSTSSLSELRSPHEGLGRLPNDPAWNAARDASEKNGKIVEKIDRCPEGDRLLGDQMNPEIAGSDLTGRDAKTPRRLRSHRWFGVDDLRAFGHRRAPGRWDSPARTTRATRNRDPEHLERPQPVSRALPPARRGGQARGVAGRGNPRRSAGRLAGRDAHEADDDALSKPAGDGDRGMLRANPVDGAVLLGGCDKTVPAMMMGATSMDLPAIFVPPARCCAATGGARRSAAAATGGSSGPSDAPAKSTTARGASWRTASPVVRHVHDDGDRVDDGRGRRGPGHDPAGRLVDSRSRSAHPRMAAAAGRRIVDMVWDDVTPKTILTAAAFDNAVTVTMAIGGSTNAIMHLIAMARRAGVALDSIVSTALAAHAGPRRHSAVRPVPDGGFLLRRRAARRCWRGCATCSTWTR